MTAVYSLSPRAALPFVERLMKHRASPNVRDDCGNTPFLHALSKGRRARRLVDLLLPTADVNLAGPENVTPLMQCVKEDYFEVVEAIMERKPNVDARDKEGNTALHYGCVVSNPYVVWFLLNKGANKNIKNYEGKTRKILPWLVRTPRSRSCLTENQQKRSPLSPV
eukprot:Rmarinus@m.17359